MPRPDGPDLDCGRSCRKIYRAAYFGHAVANIKMDSEAKVENEMAIIEAVFKAEGAEAAKDQAWLELLWKLAVLMSTKVHVSESLADFLHDYDLRKKATDVCNLLPTQPRASRIFAAIDLLEIRSKLARTESVNAAVFYRKRK